MSDPDECKFCEGVGIIPCDNCAEIDDHVCYLDGEEYGPEACRCPLGAGVDL